MLGVARVTWGLDAKTKTVDDWLELWRDVRAAASGDKFRGKPSVTEADKIRGRYEDATAMVSDLCHRRRTWTLSVPADEQRDPDLVISNSLNDIPDLLSRIDRLEAMLAGVGTEQPKPPESEPTRPLESSELKPGMHVYQIDADGYVIGNQRIVTKIDIKNRTIWFEEGPHIDIPGWGRRPIMWLSAPDEPTQGSGDTTSSE
jgi:hypothetical protein